MCVFRNVHQTGSTSKSKTLCFLHSNANCIFRPVIFGGEEKREQNRACDSREFPLRILNMRVHTQFIYIRVVAIFTKLFFPLQSDYCVWSITKKNPINNFKLKSEMPSNFAILYFESRSKNGEMIQLKCFSLSSLWNNFCCFFFGGPSSITKGKKCNIVERNVESNKLK